MWDDEYFSHLDPTEKLLFIYLITNSATNIAGIYQLQYKRMAADTGIDKDMCIKIITRFERDNKIKHENGWVAIKNFIKHQNFKSPKIQQGIDNELKNAPEELKKWVLYGMDTISHININPNINPNIDEICTKEADTELHVKVKEWFQANNSYYYHDKKQAGAINSIIKRCTFIKMDIFPLLIKFKALLTSEDKHYSKLAATPSIFLGHLDSILAIKDKQASESYEDQKKKLYGADHRI